MDLGEIGLVGSVDLIRLAQGRDRWQAVVSVLMNLWALAPQSSNTTDAHFIILSYEQAFYFWVFKAYPVLLRSGEKVIV
jgi:hypothetical protein